MDRRFDSDEAIAQAMVCVSLTSPVPSKEALDPCAGLWSAIIRTIEGRDLDAHIALLILKSSRVSADPLWNYSLVNWLTAPHSTVVF